MVKGKHTSTQMGKHTGYLLRSSCMGAENLVLITIFEDFHNGI